MRQHLRHSPLQSTIIPGPAIYIIPMLNQCLQLGTRQMSAIKCQIKASDVTSLNDSLCILSTWAEKQMLLYWGLIVCGCHPIGRLNIMVVQSIMKVMDSVIIKMYSGTLSPQILCYSWWPFYSGVDPRKRCWLEGLRYKWLGLLAIECIKISATFVSD